MRYPPINLTTVTSRPLHAVLFPPESFSAKPGGGRLLDALAAALDGSGPAILPLDPGLPRSRLDELLAAFAPAAIETSQGLHRLAPGQYGRVASPGVGGEAADETGNAAGCVADEIAVVLATSGSTGSPKGAELSSRALRFSARASLARLGADPGARWLCCLPTHHISGLGVLVRSLVAGSAPVVSGRLDADVVAAADADYVSLVPTQLRRLLDSGAPAARFRAILLGGAAVPAGLLDEAAAVGARVVTTYGMTETCGGCVYDGVPLDGVTVSSGTDGRIKISGPVLFSGYRRAPELTRSVLDDGWFVTSDLGGPGPDGRLAVRGRADDVINTGGEKVVAGEVEQALRECAGIRDAVVVGVADPDWGERVVAIVVPADPGPADPGPADPGGCLLSLERIREQVKGTLPRYSAPQGLVLIDEIPLLASGKPDRQRLRQLAKEFRHAAAARETN